MRRTLQMKPEHYIREPKCYRCKGPLVIDQYRLRKEHYAHPRCECMGYSFKHRPKSKWCVQNPNQPTEEDVVRRFGTTYEDDDCPF